MLKLGRETRPGLGFYCLWFLLFLSVSGCRQSRPYPNRPIFLICPWSAGGGTDRVSREVAALLEPVLGVPVNVINATGGAGVTGHTRGALARPDGYTLTMVTVEINMLHWRGLTNISYKDFEPIGLLNRDAAALFVRADAPWKTLKELETYIRQHPSRLKASGTAAGGIWHLGFAGWLDAVGLKPSDVVWLSINGAGPSLQELMAGGVDAVCCSLPEAQSLLESGRIRALGVMADKRLSTYPTVPTFREQGVAWSLYGWRGLCAPKGTPAEICRKLTDALHQVVFSDEFQRFMKQSGFNFAWQPPEQFRHTMEEFDQKLGRLLTSPAFQNVRQVQISPMFFPTILVVLLLLTSGVLAFQHFVNRNRSDTVHSKPLIKWSGSTVGAVLEISACVLVYVWVAETLGFVLTAAALLLWLLRRFRAGWLVSIGVTILLVPTLYELFAVMLRVPLPRGWFGW